MQAVYGNWVHAKNGSHIYGGIMYGLQRKAWWQDLVVLTLQRYDGTVGKVGWRFVQVLSTEITNIWEHRWNAKRFIVFQTVILQRSWNISVT